MATWYTTNTVGNAIETAEVTRETAQCVYVQSKFSTRVSRQNKGGDFMSYFPTWAEAHAFLVSRAERRLEDARRNLQLAQSQLGNVKGMKPPAAAPSTQEGK